MSGARPYEDFDFDLARAVLDQLVEAFDGLAIGRLDAETLLGVEARQGVYQLFLGGELVYIGKADSLQNRLLRHFRALQGRRNVDVGALGFKCLYIHKNWTTWTTEDALIKRFTGLCSWNLSGFGSNDPGRNRDHTAEKPTSFNSLYPIDPGFICEWVPPGTRSAAALLSEIKSKLPYLLRYQDDEHARETLQSVSVTIPRSDMTAGELLVAVARQLPDGWQATILPGRMLLYREHAPYAHGDVVWPEP